MLLHRSRMMTIRFNIHLLLLLYMEQAVSTMVVLHHLQGLHFMVVLLHLQLSLVRVRVVNSSRGSHLMGVLQAFLYRVRDMVLSKVRVVLTRARGLLNQARVPFNKARVLLNFRVSMLQICRCLQE